MADETIPVVEERAEVSKRRHVTGRVRVVKSARVVPGSVKIDLESETVEVRRVPADRFVDEPERAHWDGDTLVVPVMAEVPVVQKRLKVVEEIHLVRSRTTRTVEDDVQLRREEARVERRGRASNSSSGEPS